MLNGYMELWKSVIPRVIYGKYKFFALAIESMWKFMVLLVDTISKRKIIKLAPFREIFFRVKHGKELKKKN